MSRDKPRNCVTHHSACDCKEYAHKKQVETLEAKVKKLRDILNTAIPERAQFIYKCELVEKDRNAWKAQAEKLAWCVQMIVNQNRLRGYPTGPEWLMIIDDVFPALQAYEDFKAKGDA